MFFWVVPKPARYKVPINAGSTCLLSIWLAMSYTEAKVHGKMKTCASGIPTLQSVLCLRHIVDIFALVVKDIEFRIKVQGSVEFRGHWCWKSGPFYASEV